MLSETRDHWKLLFLSIVIEIACTGPMFAKGEGVSGGLTLLKAPTARASGLAEAFSAGLEDISGFYYNPASLSLLQKGQASFLFNRGIEDDSFGMLMLGGPAKFGGWGISFGYFNGGRINLFDGQVEQEVNVQTDMVASVGTSFKFGNFSLGLTGKYLSSQLVERYRAQAFAADLGLACPILSHVRFGAALQNFGSKLKFIEEGDDLPRIVRGGFAWEIIPHGNRTTLFVDAPYFLNEQQWRSSTGLEIGFGPLALRGGFQGREKGGEWSVGTGFFLGPSAFDYSFGFSQEDFTEHTFSLSLKFGGEPSARDFVRRPTLGPEYETKSSGNLRKEKVAEKHTLQELGETREQSIRAGAKPLGEEGLKLVKRQIYIVQPGDTLATVSEKIFGDKKNWRIIYAVNRHLIDNPHELEPGQKLIIPQEVK